MQMLRRGFLSRKLDSVVHRNNFSVLRCLSQVSGTLENILTPASAPNFQRKLPTNMGGSSSKQTVLNCRLKNFKKGFPEEYGVKLTLGKLCVLCELEWPAFGIGWPPEGTLDLPTVRAVY